MDRPKEAFLRFDVTIFPKHLDAVTAIARAVDDYGFAAL
jgi:hypothetical protein